MRSKLAIPGALSILLLLAACASAPGPAATPSTTPAPAPAAPPPAVAPALAAEERWLQQLFAGTPVLVAPGADATLHVEVPLKYAFDAGQAVVKPPLGAVLDKVGASLARQPRARVQVAAPDAARTNSVRLALVARGVAGTRIDRLPARADAVELRLAAPAARVDRLDDTPTR